MLCCVLVCTTIWSVLKFVFSWVYTSFCVCFFCSDLFCISACSCVRPSLDHFGFVVPMLVLLGLVFFSTEPTVWLGRTSPKRPILCPVGQKPCSNTQLGEQSYSRSVSHRSCVNLHSWSEWKTSSCSSGSKSLHHCCHLPSSVEFIDRVWICAAVLCILCTVEYVCWLRPLTSKVENIDCSRRNSLVLVGIRRLPFLFRPSLIISEGLFCSQYR